MKAGPKPRLSPSPVFGNVEGLARVIKRLRGANVLPVLTDALSASDDALEKPFLKIRTRDSLLRTPHDPLTARAPTEILGGPRNFLGFAGNPLKFLKTANERRLYS
jgi:hypothetical protein